MSLFQKSVEKKYLSELNEAVINSKYAAFQEYFGNSERQENIRNSKEEQFQEGFLRELFVNIFEYTLNPEPGFNLTTELKNVSNSRKVDGAVLNADGEAIAVIELKSTTTTDLDSIETQAFGYKNHQPKCVYVITSNFEKLRFYIEDAIDYIDFNLFDLSKKQFSLLWLCLSKDSLLNNQPLDIKKSSIVREEDITKKLYTDYSAFRKDVFGNLVKNNPDKDKLLLFKKTQKLLDRFLFIFFAEDRLLLPPNSISRIIGQWESLKKLDEYKPLYSRFVKYFGYMDKGFKGESYDIFAYNGGLFKPDEVLDNILIDDDLLLEHTRKLSQYNFDTDVDVNILGHIFEHSLVEIESIHAEINGEVVDSNKSKRKKDGIFYTPKYITQYIVENTIGRLCKEKRVELGIVDEEYVGGKRSRNKTTIIALDKKLSAYKEWLLGLTILDPACGSGAFLNMALDFLIKEHQKINVLDGQLHEENLGLHDIETDILERNIYGVDINEESVEIAKLSLWLRTAQKGRKLNRLNNNIKCGNSLIDDPEVAGDKAFNWQEEFPDVFVGGGFDVVIGNPPYGAELSEDHKIFLETHFKTFEYQVNTYVLFYEKGLDIMKANGMLGYITPATFTYQHYFKKLRALMQKYCQVGISKYFYEVFEDADIGDSVSWIMKKTENDKRKIRTQLCKTKEDAQIFPVNKDYDLLVNEKDNSYLLSESGIDFLKFYKGTKLLVEIAQIVVGIKAYQTGKGEPKQTRDIVNDKIFTSNVQINDTYIQCIIGKDFHRYRFLQEPKMFLSYGKWLAEPRNGAPFFDSEKIILRQTADSIIGHIDNRQRVNLNNVYNIGQKDPDIDLKYLLGILNSKLLNLIYQNISQEKGRTFAEVKKVNLAKLPIKVISSNSQEKMISYVDLIVSNNQKLEIIHGQLISLLQSKYEVEKVSSKIRDWSSLEFKEFSKELKKAKIKLSLSEESEWMNYFTEQKRKALVLKTEIQKTENEIDQMVYELYGLSEDEIGIVEGSGK